MKSLTAVCQTGGAAGMPAINANGRISRPAHQRGDGENAEMKMYLSKLKDLVPFMPKNRKLSKLEIIQHVIDYICDLQTELETHPDVNNFDAASALNNYAAAAAAQADVVSNQVILSQRLNASEQQQQQQTQQQQQHASPANLITNAVIRQPLVDRQTPNTILPTPAVATSSATITTITTPTTPTVHQQQQQSQTASTATTSASSLPSAAEKESKNSRLSSTAVNLF